MSSNSASENNRSETMEHFLSSLGCSWSAQDGNAQAAKISPSDPDEFSFARKISYPSFSLSHGELEEEDDGSNATSAIRREAVQSKASKLMSRKNVWKDHGQSPKQRQEHPNRVMLESILDSFDQLVDARIRAYACILNNHVQQSNNRKGARIAQYKLETLLEIASNHVLFDSISIEFKQATTSTTATGKKGDSEASGAASSTSTTTTAIHTEENRIVLPIELTVEIRSPRLHQGDSNVETKTLHGHSAPQGKLSFQALGEVRANRILATESNDTRRCRLPTRTGSSTVSHNGNGRTNINISSTNTNTSTSTSTSGEYQHNPIMKQCPQNIEVEINCDVLLSQMMNEASKVVTMAVELTNSAWKNNTQKQQELNNLYDDDTDNDNNNGNMDISRNHTANLIIADDDDDCDSTDAVEDVAQVMTGKRSRCELCDDDHCNDHCANRAVASGTHMPKQVSELCLHPPATVVVCDEEHHGKTEQDQGESSSSSSIVASVVGTTPSATATTTATTAITNLDMVARDKKYFVSVDPSFESTSFSSKQESEHDHDHDEHEDHPTERDQRERKDADRDEDYTNRITAERACHIVDFALGFGDANPACFSSNKRLRTK